MIAAAMGGIFLWVKSDSRPGVEVLLPTPSPTPEIKVYITGAVAYPGVYEVTSGDRLEDAILAAGGPTQDADLLAVNQALLLQDEDHFHIPRVGEEWQEIAPLSTAGKININTASSEVLQRLPNIGEVKAQAILDYREKNGRFEAPEDILQVTGIGPATFDAIHDLISVR